MRTRPSPPLLPLAILLLAASSCAKKDSPPWAPLSLPPGAFEGDLEIVTPIPMPQRKKGRVRVLLRLPPTGLIDVGEQGQLLLPPGARLARVEDIEKARGGYAVADVRGALFDEGGPASSSCGRRRRAPRPCEGARGPATTSRASGPLTRRSARRCAARSTASSSSPKTARARRPRS